MATVRDGDNPGRLGALPQRQSPAPVRQGHGTPGLDPTEQLGQTPDQIFGFPISHQTGAPGSQASPFTGDVTAQRGQLDDGLSGVSDGEITSTGAPGSQGAYNQNNGPDSIAYTDPFGYMGNDHRISHARAHIGDMGDWTQANDMGYAGGPTLPVLESNRPTSTGAGQGSVRGAGHPNTMNTGPQPTDAAVPNTGFPNAGR